VSGEEFSLSEARWCKEAGIDRWRAMYFRKKGGLKQGEDFSRVASRGNRTVMLSAGGIKKLEQRFSVVAAASGEEVAIEEEEKASVPSSIPLDGSVEMVVSRACANPRLVEAEVRGALGVQYVDVGSNANFVGGDKIQVIPHPEQVGLWALAGGETTDVLPRDKRRLPDGSWALT
jgi:hypothetical protein